MKRKTNKDRSARIIILTLGTSFFPDFRQLPSTPSTGIDIQRDNLKPASSYSPRRGRPSTSQPNHIKLFATKPTSGVHHVHPETTPRHPYGDTTLPNMSLMRPDTNNPKSRGQEHQRSNQTHSTAIVHQRHTNERNGTPDLKAKTGRQQSNKRKQNKQTHRTRRAGTASYLRKYLNDH